MIDKTEPLPLSSEEIGELERLLEKATEGPFYVGPDDARDCPPHRNSGLSLVDTGRVSDWPVARLCEARTAKLIAAVLNALPRLLTSLKQERGGKAEALEEVERLRAEVKDLRYLIDLGRESGR